MFWVLMGPKFDALMNSIGYAPKLPDKTPRVEFFRATEHNSCMWRDQIHRHYEPKGLPLPRLDKLEKSKLYDRPQSMEQHLLPPGEVPETAFLPGEFRRLPVPRRAKENDPYFSQSRPRASRSHSIARDLLAEALEAPPAAARRGVPSARELCAALPARRGPAPARPPAR